MDESASAVQILIAFVTKSEILSGSPADRRGLISRNEIGDRCGWTESVCPTGGFVAGRSPGVTSRNPSGCFVPAPVVASGSPASVVSVEKPGCTGRCSLCTKRAVEPWQTNQLAGMVGVAAGQDGLALGIAHVERARAGAEVEFFT